MGLLTDENMLDRKKVIREKLLVFKKNILSGKKENVGIFCIGFDDRKDQTKTSEGTVLEEHYTIIKEPGAQYIDHVTPDDGSACSTTGERVYCIVATNSVDKLHGFICDGTAVNTGWVGGVIKQLELFLEKPLQQIVFLLHLNKLPFWHLIDVRDGRTIEPTTFMSIIGKQIKKNILQLLPVTFQPISGDVPQISLEIVKDLSTDQCLSV